MERRWAGGGIFGRSVVRSVPGSEKSEARVEVEGVEREEGRGVGEEGQDDVE